jgi:hypothetical protein
MVRLNKQKCPLNQISSISHTDSFLFQSKKLKNRIYFKYRNIRRTTQLSRS